MPTVAKSAFRSFRDFAKGYSPMKIKVIRATNTDPYGPTMAQLDLIARASHNPYYNSFLLISLRRHFIDIQHVLDRRMGDHGKFWRHIFKVSQHPYSITYFLEPCCSAVLSGLWKRSGHLLWKAQFTNDTDAP